MTESTLIKNRSGIPPGRCISPTPKGENAMSQYSRRAMLAGASAIPAVALTQNPATALSPAISPENAAAVLARCEQLIDVLRTRHIREGWALDEAGAERTLNYFKRAVATSVGEDDDPEFWAACDFLRSHGQSLDWVLIGEPSGMICRSAAVSPRAAAIAAAGDPILAAIQRYHDAVRIQDRLEDQGVPAEEAIFDRACAAVCDARLALARTIPRHSPVWLHTPDFCATNRTSSSKPMNGPNIELFMKASIGRSRQSSGTRLPG
jgi:hypothetical protein